MVNASAFDNVLVLDDEHRQVFQTALTRVLAADLAESTYAEILDGLPTQTAWLETNHREPDDHPVFTLKHDSLSPRVLEKIRNFRQTFDPVQLTFSSTVISPISYISARSAANTFTQVLKDFLQATQGTKQFELRLIELLAVACHQIAVYLWNLDDGPHKHQEYEEWRDSAQDRPLSDPSNWYRPYIAPVPFYHRRYVDFDQYPNGIADIVGYWAEARIFGGVVVFNRGDSGTECKELYLHGHGRIGPKTLYPPTNQQYDALIHFLLADQASEAPTPCPIPILATDQNRWRYSAEDAMIKFNIFRDWYERKPPAPNPNEGDRTYCVRHTAVDWPELGDEQIVMNSYHQRAQGEAVDSAEVEAAIGRLRTTITPSSPLWHRWGQ
ncbi:hypothetical protein QBC44DRAFT_354930 [Cladorrhinum sp. PSN332]|nr:hypothetical protein QBC44DRAFT_354930 [Cladorrhinum sp. PSN332]